MFKFQQSFINSYRYQKVFRENEVKFSDPKFMPVAGRKAGLVAQRILKSSIIYHDLPCIWGWQSWNDKSAFIWADKSQLHFWECFHIVGYTEEKLTLVQFHLMKIIPDEDVIYYNDVSGKYNHELTEMTVVLDGSFSGSKLDGTWNYSFKSCSKLLNERPEVKTNFKNIFDKHNKILQHGQKTV